MKYRIIENFLPEEKFKQIADHVHAPGFGWYYNDIVALEDCEDDNFYFTHLLYNWSSPQCAFFDDVFRPIEILLREKADINIKAIVRIKCNLYTRTEKIVQHGMHKDYDYSHTACILGLNDCDGFTIFENGDKIESKANRMLIFDGFDKHCSTTCTDQKVRLNINFNFL